MTEFKFKEFVSVEHVGIKKVSQYIKKEWISDTEHNLLVYVAITGVNGDLIHKQPNFKMDVTLLATTDDNNLTTQVIIPTKVPNDIAVPGFIFSDRNVKSAITETLDKNLVYPLSSMEGFLYFKIPKTKTQIVVKKEISIS